MRWFCKPKVKLALIVNGLYLISLFTPSPPHARSRGFERRASRWSSRTPPVYAPLPPATGPTKAATNYDKYSDHLDVFLEQDLTLVSRPGHTLLLSPTFATKVRHAEPPDSVLLRFISFSQTQFFDNDSPMVITADGVEMWRYGDSGSVDETPSNAKVFHSITYDNHGTANETVGHEIPYEVFVQIISARRVTICLGPDCAELTPDQIEALRDLHRRGVLGNAGSG